MINASDYIIQSKYGDIDKVNLKKNFYNKKHIYFVRIAFHLKEIKYALKIKLFVCKRLKLIMISLNM